MNQERIVKCRPQTNISRTLQENSLVRSQILLYKLIVRLAVVYDSQVEGSMSVEYRQGKPRDGKVQKSLKLMQSTIESNADTFVSPVRHLA